MKKTLLCFLFLFTNLFYAQITNIEHCAGDSNFDLTIRKTELLGNLNPAETTISYHLTLEDANNNLNAISNPSAYISTENSKTIYARIDNKGIITANNFKIIVYPFLNLNAAFQPIYCTNEKTTISLTATGGKEPYLFSSDNGVTYNNNSTISNVIAGTYKFFVKDALGCINSKSVTVGPLSLLSMSYSKKDVTCFGSNDGEITLQIQGGSAPYTYILSNTAGLITQYFTSSDTNRGFSILKAGTYGIRVTDANNCSTGITQVYILEPTIAVLTATTSSETCSNNGIITANATGGYPPYSYSLNNNLYGPENVFSNLNPGSYTVYMKDSNGCVTTTLAEVKSSGINAVAGVLNVKDPICNGAKEGVITVEATGGLAPYQYSIDNGLFQPGNTFTNLGAGEYTIQIKDDKGCISLYTTQVIDPPVVSGTAAITNSTTVNDTDGQIRITSLQGVGPYTFALTDSSGLQIIPFQGSNKFTGLKSGVYGFQMKDGLGCIFSQNNITVLNKPTTLSATINVVLGNCNEGGTIIVNTIGGKTPYQYSFDNGVSFISLNTFSDLPPGSYAVKVRDADNSIVSINGIVATPISMVVNAEITSKIRCKGDTGSIAVNVTGADSYVSYSLDGKYFKLSNTFSNLSAGTYTLTVKDAAGCTAITAIDLLEPTALSATITTTNDQGLIVIAQGGTAPYTYSLQNANGIIKAPQTNGTFTQLPNGLYSVQVTDANGCTWLQSEINVLPASEIAASVSIIPISCSAGNITVKATGGVAPYVYSIDTVNFTSSNVFSISAEGIYDVYVRDAVGTMSTVQALVTKETPLSITVNPTSEVYCAGDNSGIIRLTIKDGKAPYYVSLDNAAYINFGDSRAGTFSDLRAGTHTLSVKDTYGCIATGITIISESAALIADVLVENLTITITAIGGSGQYEYSLEGINFQSNPVFKVPNYGNYKITVRDTNGCGVYVIDVTVDPPPPLIDGKDELTLEFKPGQTLADLVVEGDNIKWYSSSSHNPLDNKAGKLAAETPLPLTTVLVDGTTYYASQTINGIESKERLAVTAKLNGDLSTPDFVLPNFKLYPNPVLQNLTINNTSVIDEIEIYSVSGTTILSKKINSEHSEIDLSHVASGFYFLKVISEGQTKTVKIVKK